MPSVIIADTSCLIPLEKIELAKHLNLSFTGTIGVIIEAKKSGFLESVKLILVKIKLTNFRLSNEVEEAILKLVNKDNY